MKVKIVKNLYKYLSAVTLGVTICFSAINTPAESQVFFGIEDIQFQLYNNRNNTLLEEGTAYDPSQLYGYGVNLFMSVLITQNWKPESNFHSHTYEITVEGYGKGRDNLSQVLVEDYKIYQHKKVRLSLSRQYVPFILDYPSCTEETNYTITVVQQGTNNTVTKTIKSPYNFCALE